MRPYARVENVLSHPDVGETLLRILFMNKVLECIYYIVGARGARSTRRGPFPAQPPGGSQVMTHFL